MSYFWHPGKKILVDYDEGKVTVTEMRRIERVNIGEVFGFPVFTTTGKSAIDILHRDLVRDVQRASGNASLKKNPRKHRGGGYSKKNKKP